MLTTLFQVSVIVLVVWLVGITLWFLLGLRPMVRNVVSHTLGGGTPRMEDTPPLPGQMDETSMAVAMLRELDDEHFHILVKAIFSDAVLAQRLHKVLNEDDENDPTP